MECAFILKKKKKKQLSYYTLVYGKASGAAY